MNRALFALVLLGLTLPACEKKETPAASTATPAASAPAAGSAAQASSDGEGLPIEEDFEDEAEQKISAQNADEELDKLEKEISE